jgi:hypothetical protein
MSFDLVVWYATNRLSDPDAVRLGNSLFAGQIDGIAPYSGIDAFYEELTSKHPESDAVPEDEVDNTELCPWSVPIERSPGHVAMSCVWPRAEYVNKLVHRLARKHRLSVYDPQLGRVFYPTGDWDFCLSIEGKSSICSPSSDDVQTVLKQMTPKGGPGFMILEGRGSDYAQAAGGDGTLTVEWREYEGPNYRHWKAGIKDQESDGQVAIATNGFVARVRPNERLSVTEATEILCGYLEGKLRPTKFAWRDMKM